MLASRFARTRWCRRGRQRTLVRTLCCCLPETDRCSHRWIDECCLRHGEGPASRVFREGLRAGTVRSFAASRHSSSRFGPPAPTTPVPASCSVFETVSSTTLNIRRTFPAGCNRRPWVSRFGRVRRLLFTTSHPQLPGIARPGWTATAFGVSDARGLRSTDRQPGTPDRHTASSGTEGREGASEEEAFEAAVRSDASVPTSVGRGRSIEMRPVRRGKRTGKLAARITDQRQFELQLASLSMSNLPAIYRNRSRMLPP